MSSIRGFVVLRAITKELALVVGCYLTFALAKNLTDPSPVLKAVSNGWSVLRFENVLALNQEPFVQQTIGRVSLGSLVALTYFYAIGMWLGLITMAVTLFIKNRPLYIYLRRIFVLLMLLAAVVFAVLLVVIYITRIWMRYDYLLSKLIQDYSHRTRQFQFPRAN